MPRILTQDLVPGMVTAEDVLTYTNQLILPKDFELTDKAITKLEFYSILSVRIKDETADIVPESSETEGLTYSEKIKASAEYREFKKAFEISVEEIRDFLNDFAAKRNVTNLNKMLDEAMRLLKDNPSGIHVFDMLHNMRHYDDPTFAHSLNVALICYVFGKWLDFNDEQLNILTLCGLLHDIGKLTIPEEILAKPAKLTNAEYRVVQTHTVQGYNLIKELNINEHVKNAVLMHHERCDGTGYPFGITAERIDRYAKIVSIADVYDAMTSARIYRGPLCPFEVISIFESEGLQKYDSEYILTFLEYIVNTYVNNRVRLSNGLEGDIVMINRRDLSHPMVHCGDRYIDLSHEHGLSIEAII